MAGLLYLQHAIDASRLSADRTRHRSHKIRRQAGPRNPLKGTIGAVLHAVMCGAGHNIRLLLKKLQLLCRPHCRRHARMAGGKRAASIYPHGLGWLKTALFSADELPNGCKTAVLTNPYDWKLPIPRLISPGTSQLPAERGH